MTNDGNVFWLFSMKLTRQECSLEGVVRKMEDDVEHKEKKFEVPSAAKDFLSQHGKHVSSLTYLVLFILFMMPWVAVSCSGMVVASYSGFSLARMDLGLMLAVILLVIGIIVGILEKERVVYFSGLFISGVTTLAMLFVTFGTRSIVADAVNTFGSGMYLDDMSTVQYRPAFYIAWIVAVGSFAYNWYMLNNYTEGVHRGEILDLYRNSVIWQSIAKRADKATSKSTAEQEVKPKNKEMGGNGNEQENQSK